VAQKKQPPLRVEDERSGSLTHGRHPGRLP
jgi:hypothetical protein